MSQAPSITIIINNNYCPYGGEQEREGEKKREREIAIERGNFNQYAFFPKCTRNIHNYFTSPQSIRLSPSFSLSFSLSLFVVSRPLACLKYLHIFRAFCSDSLKLNCKRKGRSQGSLKWALHTPLSSLSSSSSSACLFFAVFTLSFLPVPRSRAWIISWHIIFWLWGNHLICCLFLKAAAGGILQLLLLLLCHMTYA